MSKGLEKLKDIKQLLSLNQYGGDKDKQVVNDELYTIEKELKDYYEIKEIAKRYKWDDITSEIFNVETDKKYRDLFDSAIVNIQEDYRKARALEIIKNKRVNVGYLIIPATLEEYNELVTGSIAGKDRQLTQ
ncbi:MAG: hypothetical protein IKJ59_00325, partial [Clostridia bacterium]|nr:hypothetical protein [Clostridia bacterium]